MPTWLVPTLVTGGLTLLTGALGAIWREIKASEARQQKALQAVQNTLQAMEARQREDMRAMETRQQEDMRAMETRQREDIRELRSKVDRLMEGPVAARN